MIKNLIILTLCSLISIHYTFAGVEFDDDEPGCPDPDLHGKDYHGHKKDPLSVQYDYSKFETMEGNGARLLTGEIKATRVILKAPVHTCRIKTAPGLREWINTMVKNDGIYNNQVIVQPFSQPPNFNFYDQDDNIIERVKVDDEVTIADIRAFLRSRGVYANGELVNSVPVNAVNIYEEEEVDADVLEARQELAKLKQNIHEQNIQQQQQEQNIKYKQSQQQRHRNNDEAIYDEADISVTGASTIRFHTTTEEPLGLEL